MLTSPVLHFAEELNGILYRYISFLILIYIYMYLLQGMAFTLEERQQLNIHGLLPPCFLGQDVQVFSILKNFERLTSDLDR